MRLDRLMHDLPRRERSIEHTAREGARRTCQEASGACYIPLRALWAWRYTCEATAPSLMPMRPGVRT